MALAVELLLIWIGCSLVALVLALALGRASAEGDRQLDARRRHRERVVALVTRRAARAARRVPGRERPPAAGDGQPVSLPASRRRFVAAAPGPRPPAPAPAPARRFARATRTRSH